MKHAYLLTYVLCYVFTHAYMYLLIQFLFEHMVQLRCFFICVSMPVCILILFGVYGFVNVGRGSIRFAWPS